MQDTSSKADLPAFLTALKIGGNVPGISDCYDVKFYPYTSRDVEPIFAAVCGRSVLICRLNHEETRPIEIIFAHREDSTLDGENSLWCLDWSQAANGDPLLLISGEDPRIKVLNVKTRKLVHTLVGHGASVHSLAVSPVDPTILASASDDCAIRLWTLEPVYMKQPTAAILFGHGNKEGVMTTAFHRKGKYLLSGGYDSRVNLWMVPKDLKANLGTDKPHFVHYPHFSSTDVHQNYVDCVQFHNDIIFSRAAGETRIIAWRIDNFNGERDPPHPPPMPEFNVVKLHTNTPMTNPSPHVSGTRSAWGGRYQTLLQFDVPHSDLFYLSFSIFHQMDQHPILAAGNQKNNIFFWDLEKLEEFKVNEEIDRVFDHGKATGTVLTHANRLRDTSDMESESASTHSTDTAMDTGTTTPTSTVAGLSLQPQPFKKPYRGRPSKKGKTSDYIGGIANPFQPIPAHKVCTIPAPIREVRDGGKSRAIENHVTRQIAWSRGGDWCVVGGSLGVVSVFERWGDGWPGEEEKMVEK